jgi:hypothetical protein
MTWKVDRGLSVGLVVALGCDGFGGSPLPGVGTPRAQRPREDNFHEDPGRIDQASGRQYSK